MIAFTEIIVYAKHFPLSLAQVVQGVSPGDGRQPGT
jgi:hypothetical protein